MDSGSMEHFILKNISYDQDLRECYRREFNIAAETPGRVATIFTELEKFESEFIWSLAKCNRETESFSVTHADGSFSPDERTVINIEFRPIQRTEVQSDSAAMGDDDEKNQVEYSGLRESLISSDYDDGITRVDREGFLYFVVE